MVNIKLKVAIVKSGKRQSEVAHACGITELAMSQIVCGRKTATIDEKEKIATLLKQDVADLF